MKLMRRKLERELNEGLIALKEILEQVAEIERRANSDAYTGFGAGGSDGRRAGVSDPTGVAGIARAVYGPDRQAELTVAQFKDEVYAAHRAAIRARSLMKALLAIDPKEARKLARDAPADARTICANPACRADILNLPNDRPREGRCENCYRFRKEHWGNERPRDLCHPEQVEVVG